MENLAKMTLAELEAHFSAMAPADAVTLFEQLKLEGRLDEIVRDGAGRKAGHRVLPLALALAISRVEADEAARAERMREVQALLGEYVTQQVSGPPRDALAEKIRAEIEEHGYQPEDADLLDRLCDEPGREFQLQELAGSVDARKAVKRRLDERLIAWGWARWLGARRGYVVTERGRKAFEIISSGG